jgi:hypothetical protein
VSRFVLNVTLVVATWLTVCALLLMCLVFLQLSFNRLRSSHRETWRVLGEPHVLGDFRAFYPARKFLWSKQCLALGDELLARRARFSYYLGMGGAVLGLSLAMALVCAAIFKVR